jgi:UDP-N-acetylmuramoyl-tripeptide--D-alanyl-D-alanine ligase
LAICLNWEVTVSMSIKQLLILLKNEDTIDCYFIGKDFYQNKIDNQYFHFYETFESFVFAIEKISFHNKMILIKGSRGMALERVLELI